MMIFVRTCFAEQMLPLLQLLHCLHSPLPALQPLHLFHLLQIATIAAIAPLLPGHVCRGELYIRSQLAWPAPQAIFDGSACCTFGATMMCVCCAFVAACFCIHDGINIMAHVRRQQVASCCNHSHHICRVLSLQESA